MQIKICDCTLQNGGKICDWYFGEEVIDAIIKNMKKLKIDILELGMLQQESLNVDRSVYGSIKDIRKLQFLEMSNILLSLTLNVQNGFEMMKLEECKDNNLIIRVQFTKKYIKEAIECCSYIRKKGYRISVHPLCSHQYSECEFCNMLNLIKVYAPEIIYLDDSIGMLLYNDEFEKWLAFIDKYETDFQIGLCGYYIPHQAISLIKYVKKMNLKHPIVIDSSIGGIGIGAGMFPTELFFCREKRIIIEDLYIKYIKNLRKKYQWGMAVDYEIALEYGINPAYVDYLELNYVVDAMDIHYMLAQIPKEKRDLFDKDLADVFFYEYMKKKYDLVVIVPTANRAGTIEYWLGIAAWEFYRLGIDIVIYDSSKDDKTEVVVFNYICSGCKNVTYQRYKGKVEEYSIDRKVIDAYIEYYDQYKYIWICRDGLALYPIKALNVIGDAIKKEADVIICNAEFRDYKSIGNRIYTNADILFRDQCAQMTLLGSTIIKGNIIKDVIKKIPLEIGRNFSLWQPFSILEYLADKEFYAQSCVGEIFGYNPSAPAKQFWKSNSMHIWCEAWYENIKNLPSIYDKYKNEVLKIEMIDFHPFSLIELLKIRASGGLSISIIRKNKKNILAVCDTKLFNFYVIALLPRMFVKLMFKSVNSSLRKVTRVLYYVLIGELPESEELHERNKDRKSVY